MLSEPIYHTSLAQDIAKRGGDKPGFKYLFLFIFYWFILSPLSLVQLILIPYKVELFNRTAH